MSFSTRVDLDEVLVFYIETGLVVLVVTGEESYKILLNDAEYEMNVVGENYEVSRGGSVLATYPDGDPGIVAEEIARMHHAGQLNN